MMIEEWGEYKGMKYPLQIKSQNAFSQFKTDYWDPSKHEAEKTFRISFNPNDLVRR